MPTNITGLLRCMPAFPAARSRETPSAPKTPRADPMRASLTPENKTRLVMSLIPAPKAKRMANSPARCAMVSSDNAIDT